jgi:hypothetical protein
LPGNGKYDAGAFQFMKTIKIDFCDFWQGFDRHQNYFTQLLSRYFKVVVCDDPDFLFFSNTGYRHKTYNCVKIYYTGESFPPDYIDCDYSVSFELIENQRNLRYPLYILYGDMHSLLSPKKPYAEVRKQHTKFCNMVVSNARATKRIDFFHKLSQYKQVDSGGRYLNNIGGPIGNKMEFISQYKFSIAFENKSQDGYTTEKLVEPMFCGSMPVYWGNKKVALDFNPASFINWDDYGSDEAVIERIIQLDQNDDLYEEVYNQPYFIGNEVNRYCNEDRLVEFLSGIFSSRIRNARYYYGRTATIEYYKARVFAGGVKNKILSILQ